MPLTLIRLTGTASAVAMAMLLMNYLIKLGNQLIVCKLPKGAGADAYRKCMRFIVLQHRKIAVLFCILAVAHGYLTLAQGYIRISGLLLALLILWTVLLGLYGHHISRNPRGGWFPFHRMGVLILTWVLILHILYQ